MVGYDASLGSMGQLAGVAGRIKMLGGFWPMIGCILTFICFKLIYNISDEKMREVSESLRLKSEAQEKEVLKEMNK